jgi:pimeloyl-ACP methyl ester carboxylesterase
MIAGIFLSARESVHNKQENDSRRRNLETNTQTFPALSWKQMTRNIIEPAAHSIAGESVCSADGTRIGFYRLGSGPAIVFVHGSISKNTDWTPVAKLLAHSFTCFVIDRRGRGRSGHGESPYSIERECEDIAAAVAVAGPEVALVGHSYGGICTLEAALRTHVRKLVVYEPPLPVGGPIAGKNLAPYVQAVERGDFDAAIALGLAQFSGYSAEAVAQMRASRGWPRLCALAPTWIRELEVMDSFSPDVDRYRALSCPVLLLEGSESPEHPLKNAARTLTALPEVRLETLAGHDHVAMRTAPALVASLIASFLSA